MKYRIVELNNGIYVVQRRTWFMENWNEYSSFQFKTEKEARDYINSMIEVKMRDKKIADSFKPKRVVDVISD